jgi:hypothetical protein
VGRCDLDGSGAGEGAVVGAVNTVMYLRVPQKTCNFLSS